MRSDTRASTNSCQALLDVSAGQTQTDLILQDSKMTQRASLCYRLLLHSSQRLLMEKEPILPYADRSLRLVFQKFWLAEDTQSALQCSGALQCVLN